MAIFNRDFLLGAGSVLDLFPNPVRLDREKDGFERDRENLSRDWLVIGNDIAKALSTVEEEIRVK
jgi:hypothetical protein